MLPSLAKMVILGKPCHWCTSLPTLASVLSLPNSLIIPIPLRRLLNFMGYCQAPSDHLPSHSMLSRTFCGSQPLGRSFEGCDIFCDVCYDHADSLRSHCDTAFKPLLSTASPLNIVER